MLGKAIYKVKYILPKYHLLKSIIIMIIIIKNGRANKLNKLSAIYANENGIYQIIKWQTECVFIIFIQQTKIKCDDNTI